MARIFQIRKPGCKSLTIILIILSYYQGVSQSLSFEPCVVSVQSSFRGISVVSDTVVWVSGNNGWVGRSVNGAIDWNFLQIPGFEKFDFRTIYAFDEHSALLATAGAPAFILLTRDGGTTWKEVYKNEDPAAFIDGVDFWNHHEGLIYGDPINGKMLLLYTHDGGTTWQLVSEQSRPMLHDGEASFAASGTGIQCLDESMVVIATGGKTSRLFISQDKGKSWNISTPEIIQGRESTGIFSVNFWSSRNGIIVGGDFQYDSLLHRNSLYTRNGGKTWHLPVTPPRGYRECVVHLSKKMALATGPSGTDITRNGGKDWQSVNDEKSFHVLGISPSGKLIVMAGVNKISRVRR
ncbi:MAG: hypothetical protein JNJ65_18140 [Cyclobacteriaceae bacterium]|nr:hypothetical protein [Cyclobacteriaceae bacterium]